MSCPPTPSTHIVPVPHRSSFQTDVNRYIQGRQLDRLHTSIECPACGHVLRRSYRDLATSAPHHCPACHITFRVDRCLVMKRYNHILAQRRTREHELDEPVTSTPPVLLRPSVPALPLVEDLLRNRRELTSG